jgi:predicted DNA-binding transcriptional regulator YafY
MSSQALLSHVSGSRVRALRGCGYPALLRIVRIHERLGNEHQITAKSIAQEFEVAPRTIKRDIEFMRDQLGVAIVWDATTHTYFCTHHHPLLPLLRIDADEALALALAGRTFAAWHGSPLGRALTAALEKIAPIVGGAVSLPVDALKDLLFTSDDPTADAEHRHFATLLEAIHRRRELRLEYQKPKAHAAAEARTVHPLHLAYLEHRWMLVAHDVARNAPRNFLLARIRDAKATGPRFEPPAGFDAKIYLRGSLGRFTGETEHEVRIVLDAVAAPYVRERPWHPSQKITERPDGTIEATFRLNNLIDIERRLLACGAHAEVLAPPELRETIRAAAVAMCARYASDVGPSLADVPRSNGAKKK